MAEDIEITNKLETIDAKEDIIISKLDEIILALDNHSTILSNILSNIDSTSQEQSEEEYVETTSQFKEELQAKINEGLPYDQVKDWIIETLANEGIYSEENIVIKIFTNRLGDIVLEVKSRPYIFWGRLLQFMQDSMGDADKFETSRYTMRVIEWWNLTKNMQMEEQHTTTDIVDEVNEQWGDNDQINFGN